MTCDPTTDLRAVLAIVVLAGVILGLAAALLVMIADRQRKARRDERARRLPTRLGATHPHRHAEALCGAEPRSPHAGAAP